MNTISYTILFFSILGCIVFSFARWDKEDTSTKASNAKNKKKEVAV